MWQEELQNDTKYYNPLNEEKIKQGYERTKRNDKHKEYRDNHKEEASEYHKAHRALEKRKTKLQQSKKEYYERDKFNILAKAKQQLRECEIRKCQNKGGESHLTRHKKTHRNINNVKKKDEQ